MIHARPFLMARHGQSEANLKEIASGHIDAALTDLGRDQARAAGKLIAALPENLRPKRIIHSHLSRARHTAELINDSLGGLPMSETPDIAEQNFGIWEGQAWSVVGARIRANEKPDGGESWSDFQTRITRGINFVLKSSDDFPLVVCHGGVFHAFASLYNEDFDKIMNCGIYHFAPREHAYPWAVGCLSDQG